MGGYLCWLLGISVPKSASPMTLSGPFPLHLSSKQMAIELFTVLLPAPFLERISQVASTTHQRRFARAIGPQQTKHAARDGQSGIVQSVDPATIDFRETSESNLHGGSFLLNKSRLPRFREQ
jgi:hypothetical protein